MTTLPALVLGKPITERDIVDGHRAKTLSLLWFILLRFQVTALLNPRALSAEISFLSSSIKLDVLAPLLDEGKDKSGAYSEMENNQRALFLWTRAVCASGGYNVEVCVSIPLAG